MQVIENPKDKWCVETPENYLSQELIN